MRSPLFESRNSVGNAVDSSLSALDPRSSDTLYTANNQFAGVPRAFLEAGTSNAQFRRHEVSTLSMSCRRNCAVLVHGLRVGCGSTAPRSRAIGSVRNVRNRMASSTKSRSCVLTTTATTPGPHSRSIATIYQSLPLSRSVRGRESSTRKRTRVATGTTTEHSGEFSGLP